MGCFISTEKRIQRITKASSFKFLVQHGATTQPLERCAELYSEADNDKDGKLSYEQFLNMFSLKSDHYTQQLCKIFDSDNSGQIGFREFVYNLAKFNDESFSQEVKFAYRLFDLDGSGALDKSEAVTVLRDAMRSDLSQYGQRGALPKVDMSQKDSIRALVDEISNRTGTNEIGISEFEMMCSRMPRIYQPAKYLFLLMNKTSKEAYRAVSTMSPDGLKALMQSIGRAPNKGGRLGFDSDKAPTRVYRPPATVDVPKKNRSGVKAKDGDGQDVSVRAGTANADTSVKAGAKAEASVKAGTKAEASVKAGTKAETSVRAGAEAETSVRAGAKAETSVRAGAAPAANPSRQSLPVKGASTKR